MTLFDLMTGTRRPAASLVVALLATVLLAGCAPSAPESGGSPGAATGVAWQPRESGLPAFYYFGAPG